MKLLAFLDQRRPCSVINYYTYVYFQEKKNSTDFRPGRVILYVSKVMTI